MGLHDCVIYGALDVYVSHVLVCPVSKPKVLNTCTRITFEICDSVNASVVLLDHTARVPRACVHLLK